MPQRASAVSRRAKALHRLSAAGGEPSQGRLVALGDALVAHGHPDAVVRGLHSADLGSDLEVALLDERYLELEPQVAACKICW